MSVTPGTLRRWILGGLAISAIVFNSKLGLGLDGPAQMSLAAVAVALILGSNLRAAVAMLSQGYQPPPPR